MAESGLLIRSLSDIAARIRRREVSSVAVTYAVLGRREHLAFGSYDWRVEHWLVGSGSRRYRLRLPGDRSRWLDMDSSSSATLWTKRVCSIWPTPTSPVPHGRITTRPYNHFRHVFQTSLPWCLQEAQKVNPTPPNTPNEAPGVKWISATGLGSLGNRDSKKNCACLYSVFSKF
jgi:hypothetical protein